MESLIQSQTCKEASVKAGTTLSLNKDIEICSTTDGVIGVDVIYKTQRIPEGAGYSRLV